MCHVERYTRSASNQWLQEPSIRDDNNVLPKSPKSKRNEGPAGNTSGEKDTQGNVNNNDPEVPKENPIDDNQVKTMEDDGKTISLGGAIKATMAFPHKKAKSKLEEDKIVPMDKINEDLEQGQVRSQKA